MARRLRLVGLLGAASLAVAALLWFAQRAHGPAPTAPTTRTPSEEAARPALEGRQPHADAHHVPGLPAEAEVLAIPGDGGAGCELFLILSDADRALVGQTCNFRAGGTNHDVVLDAQRARLGRFAGGYLDVFRVGDVQADGSLHDWILPRAGSVEMRWMPRPEPLTATLRFKGPQSATESMSVALVTRPLEGPSDFESGAEAESRATSVPPASLEVRVRPGSLRYAYLARCGAAWATGVTPVVDEPREFDVLVTWRAGCRLEVVLPAGNSAKSVDAYLISDPAVHGATDAFPDALRSGWDTDNPPGRFDFAGGVAAPAAFRWKAVALDSGEWVVPSAPHGCRLRVVAFGTRWGTLQRDVAIPVDAETERVELASGTEVVVRLEDERGAVIRGRAYVGVSRDGDSRGVRSTSCEAVDGRMTATGLDDGESIRVDAFSPTLLGSAEVSVRDGLLVPLVMRARPQVRARVRVLDGERRPLAAKNVEFRDNGSPIVTVVTDAAGRAEVDVPRNGIIGARVVEPGWQSRELRVDLEGGLLELPAWRTRKILIEFQIGNAHVATTLRHGGGSASGHWDVRRRVVAGSVLEVDAGAGPEAQLTVADVDPGPTQAAPWFDRTFLLEPSGVTVVRVTRP